MFRSLHKLNMVALSQSNFMLDFDVNDVYFFSIQIYFWSLTIVVLVWFVFSVAAHLCFTEKAVHFK